ncbi:hypothetical protein [Halothece sp. PCC 7418]|uniref:hypothetical protein n=1 Tax=Halothece sp. (strain PCC 7418) TaxID=65093 RepID=UPI0003172EEC|nr:hypothetical protein [Halothece sp. PCC 7418]
MALTIVAVTSDDNRAALTNRRFSVLRQGKQTKKRFRKAYSKLIHSPKALIVT